MSRMADSFESMAKTSEIYLSPKSLRNLIGNVPQQFILWKSSIMENVRSVRRDVTDEEVIEACRKAGAFGCFGSL